MNLNSDNEEKETKDLQEIFGVDQDARELLGIPGFERLLQELQNPIISRDEPAIPNEELFFLPVRINLQTLLDDLERILRFIDRPGAAYWNDVSRGLFEMLLVKYRLYYTRLMRLGRKEKARHVQEQMIRALKGKLADLEAKQNT